MLYIKSYKDEQNNFYCIDFLDNSGVINTITEISLNFDMISDTDKEDGMGIGLAFSNSIIRSWNGRLSVSRTEQKDDNLTTFSISLPLIH
jgi:nitrogen-specific signal transduction histidine kinase